MQTVSDQISLHFEGRKAIARSRLGLISKLGAKSALVRSSTGLLPAGLLAALVPVRAGLRPESGLQMLAN